MNIARFLILSVTVALGSLVASAQQVAAEAFVSSVVGSATVTLPGGTKAIPLVSGQKLPEGAVVETVDGGVTIQSHQGIETGLGAKTSAVIGAHAVSAEGVRTAVIDLKQGTVVSVLDPSKRAINNYAVRTPKGVAAARGTTYTTTVKLSSGGEATVVVNTVTGDVSFSISGGPTVNVSEGRSAASNRGVSTSIAEAINNAASDTEKAAIAEALKTTVIVVAALDQAGSNAVGGPTQPLLKTVVENVTKAANAVDDTSLASDLVSSTVDSVQKYAGPGGQSAINAAINNASNSLKAVAQQAESTQETKVLIVIAPNPNPNPTPTPTPGPAPVITIPTPDITIIVSPAS